MKDRKYHALAPVAAFISVVILTCLAIVFGPLLVLIMIIYRLLVPYRPQTDREKMDEEWQVKHHSFIVSRN